MKSKSIFIAADLIPALLDGRKKCMRRIMKPQPTGEYARTFSEIAMYQPGDILYVRETWHKYIKRVGKGESCHLAEFYGYKASIANSEDANEPWKSPVCMPKEAARIWLKVTNVRVERLQEITVDGCHREGINIETSAVTDGETLNRKHDFSLEKFETLWDSTVKKSDIDRYGWDANPWVWVIEFERCEKPEGV
jgi:hypothetical protein